MKKIKIKYTTNLLIHMQMILFKLMNKIYIKYYLTYLQIKITVCGNLQKGSGLSKITVYLIRGEDKNGPF